MFLRLLFAGMGCLIADFIGLGQVFPADDFLLLKGEQDAIGLANGEFAFGKVECPVVGVLRELGGGQGEDWALLKLALLVFRLP